MTVTIDVPPTVEAAARAAGVPVGEFVARLVASAPLPTQRPNLVQLRATLDAMAAGSDNRPVLTREAMTREEMYD